jgi:preprotein translocase subunit SecD
MNWRKFMLGLIAALVIACGWIVGNDGERWPYAFKKGLDVQGGIHLVLEARPTREFPRITPEVRNQAIAVVRARVDGLGVAEPMIQPQGAERVIVDLPGVANPDEALRVLGATATLSFKAHAADLASAPGTPAAPPTLDADWVDTGLTGAMVDRVQVEPDGDGWAVIADFDAAGRTKLGAVSRQLVGKPMAIFLDDRLVSAPIVEQVLDSGNVRIHGDFTAAKARELEVVMEAGSLPVPLAIIENRSIDASLGADAVQRSVMAGGVGAALVMAFMAGYYRLPGMVANAALLVYALLVLALFKLVPVTLTVPGIAGFVLSLGMAVDANVLIFERTKEELAAGLPVHRAIEAGFQRAFSAILDSNVTTLLACAVLFAFGAGMVKGFALTLALGVVASMFTAIAVTRHLLHAWLEARPSRPQDLFGKEATHAR